MMEDGGPHCMRCVDLGHLDFLPAGNTALTRRAKQASRLSAVVVRWSRARKRYERQGILAEPDAIEQAEQRCLADADVREWRRAREQERRQVADVALVAEFAAAIHAQFPGCPRRRADEIARHAALPGSGRVARSRAGRELDPDAVRLAVAAAVRHHDTSYQDLIMAGVSRLDARRRVRDDVDRILAKWSHSA